MDSAATARHFSSVGRYLEALEALPSADRRRETSDVQLLRAELLMLVGDTVEPQLILQDLQQSRILSEVEKSHLEFVRAGVAKEQGHFDAELRHLQKSISFAERG